MLPDSRQPDQRPPHGPDAASTPFKPQLRQLLHSLRLDVVYDRGAGNSLFYRNEHGANVEVLDLVGGYGALLLGHSHPELTAEAIRILSEQRPAHAQGSVRLYATRLAAALSERAGGHYCVVFANSGAEAVEAAIKHALLQTGGKTFLALEGAFHGKTLGALQLTANPDYRDGLDWPGLEVARVRPNAIDSLEAAFANTARPAGLIIEPVLGEGGVHPLEPGFCQRASELCRAAGIPLIADECQTGLGRTGTFLASEELGVRPDYVVLSKALGGGLAKISALLVDRPLYEEAFDLKHTSTYADDDFSCAIALKVLELIGPERLAQVTEKGGQLRAALQQLAEAYPDVLAEVRGRGLMIGLPFREASRSASMGLRYLSRQKNLLYVITAYLLHVHRIRVAPTLSDRFTLRLEPSLLITASEIRRVAAALEDVCQKLRAENAAALTAFLAEPAEIHRPRSGLLERQFFFHDEERSRKEKPAQGMTCVAWLCHLVDADDLIHLDANFASWTRDQRERFLARTLPRAWPIVMNGVTLRSRTGESVWLWPIALPCTSRWIREELDQGGGGAAAALVQRGLDAAADLGCHLAALGQYTSIVTRNGTRLQSRGLGVTTGNSYALWLALEALSQAERRQGLLPADRTLAIVGALGNIGRAAAALLAPQFRETVLIGRNTPQSRQRLSEMTKHVPRSRAALHISEVAGADSVFAATNAVDTPLRPEHCKAGAILCDLSVPAAMAPRAASVRPDLTVIRGGIAALPQGESLGIAGFPLPDGQAYGCMAEGIVLGLKKVRDTSFTGTITVEKVRRVAGWAQQHGFTLALAYEQSVLEGRIEEQCYAR